MSVLDQLRRERAARDGEAYTERHSRTDEERRAVADRIERELRADNLRSNRRALEYWRKQGASTRALKMIERSITQAELEELNTARRAAGMPTRPATGIRETACLMPGGRRGLEHDDNQS